MGHRSDPAHATYGRWKRITGKNGILRGIQGSFEQQDFGHAHGTARHLVHATLASNPGPAKDGNNYVVTLGPDDRLADYEAWLISIGKLKNRIVPEEEEDRNVLAYKPLPERLVAHAIGRAMTWQGADSPGQATAVTATDDPEIAFQAAFYLHKKGFIEAKTFWSVNAQVAHAIRSGEPDEYRLSILPDKLHEFEKEFPEAGKLKGTSDRGVLKEIARRSESMITPRQNSK